MSGLSLPVKDSIQLTTRKCRWRKWWGNLSNFRYAGQYFHWYCHISSANVLRIGHWEYFENVKCLHWEAVSTLHRLWTAFWDSWLFFTCDNFDYLLCTTEALWGLHRQASRACHRIRSAKDMAKVINRRITSLVISFFNKKWNTWKNIGYFVVFLLLTSWNADVTLLVTKHQSINIGFSKRRIFKCADVKRIWKARWW